MGQSVIVSGASSQLGIFLLPRLKQAGFRVTALSRRAPAVPEVLDSSISWVHDSYLTQGSVAQANRIFSSRFLVSCGPLDLAHKLVESCPGLDRVVVFSTSSVLTKSASGNRAESELMLRISAQETALRKRCGKRGLPLLILRPTLIYGCGMDNNVSLLARFGRRAGFVPLATDSGGLRQPVHADDLAAAAVAALQSARPLDFDSPACGGSILSYRDMAALAMAGLCGKARVLPLPAALLSGLVGMLSRLGPWQGLNAEMVQRQSQDMVFDDSALTEALNCHPRPFAPTRADFEVPEAAASLQFQDPLS